MADTNDNSGGGSPAAKTAGTEFERSIGRSTTNNDTAAANSGERASLKEKLNDDLASVQETMKDVADKATDKATEMAERQKSFAADQIGKIAGALQRVGEELQADEAGPIGGYATQLAASARQFADQVKDKNFSEIAGLAENFGRRQPFAFLGIAAVAGLAASRFLMASKPTSGPTTLSARSTPNNLGETYNGQ